jgi:hypothetical protein
MQEEEYQAHHEQDVNHSGADVKCEKPKQPKNDKNCRDYPKHLFRLLSGARTPAKIPNA